MHFGNVIFYVVQYLSLVDRFLLIDLQFLHFLLILLRAGPKVFLAIHALPQLQSAIARTLASARITANLFPSLLINSHSHCTAGKVTR